MEMPHAEIVDRLAILILKCERIGDEYLVEYYKFSVELMLNFPPSDMSFVMGKLKELVHANADIWDLESDIRFGREKELGIEEVGRRALKIRKCNGVRINIKNEISEHFNEFTESRVDHGSASGIVKD